jgi:predicted enzyme related to lactoylglutathione lyase
VRTEGVCAGSGLLGIDGGIEESADGDDFVTFYVQVPDVEAALERVEELGGRRIGEPVAAGNVLFALFRDPRGNRIGLVRAAPVG